MRRKLLNFAAAVSLLLCAMASVFWVVSRGRGFYLTCNWITKDPVGAIGYVPDERGLTVSAENGCACLRLFSDVGSNGYDPERKRLNEVQTRGPRLHGSVTESDPPRIGSVLSGQWFYWKYGMRMTNDTEYIRILVVPLWSTVAAFFILPAVAAMTMVRRRRRAGLCRRCGYNLTGNTSGVCPECGPPVAGKFEAPG